MKKLFVAVALVAGLSTSVSFANNMTTNNVQVEKVTDEYTLIEVKDVPQAIQDAVAKNYANSAIKEAHVKTSEDGSKIYKIILINGEQTESIILFNETGEEVKEETAQ